MYLKYIFKELVKRKSKTVTVVLTVAVVTATLFLFSGVMNAYSTGIYKPFEDTGSDMVLQKSVNSTKNPNLDIRMPFGKELFSKDEILKIKALDHIQNISGSLILWSFDKGGFVSIEGLEDDSKIFYKKASQIYEGRFLKNEGETVVEKHFAKFNNWIVGSNISIGDKTFKVVGTLSSEEGQIFSSNIYIKAKDAYHLFGTRGFNQIYLKVDELSSEKQTKNEIQEVNKDIITISGNSLSASLSNVVNIFAKFYYLGLGMMTLIAVLILLKIYTINLLERKKDIAIMRSVGWSKKDITKQITTELFVQTILGYLLGLFVSFVIVGLFGNINIRVSGLGLSESKISIPISISMTAVFQYFVLIIAVSMIVSFLLTQKISEIKPSDNLRSV